jgi:hypothetical protein
MFSPRDFLFSLHCQFSKNQLIHNTQPQIKKPAEGDFDVFLVA